MSLREVVQVSLQRLIVKQAVLLDVDVLELSEHKDC